MKLTHQITTEKRELKKAKDESIKDFREIVKLCLSKKDKSSLKFLTRKDVLESYSITQNEAKEVFNKLGLNTQEYFA